MSLAPIGIALVCAAMAALCAAVEGAMTEGMEGGGTADSEPPGGGGGGGGGGGRARASRIHAVAIGRLAGQLGAAIAATYAVRLGQSLVSTALWTVLLVATVVFVLDAIPRAMGATASVRQLAALERVAIAAAALLAPLVAITTRAGSVIERALPSPKGEDEERESRVPAPSGNAATASSELDQREILRRVFALREIEVRDIMVPRVDVVGVERETPWSEVVDRARSSEHARLPVYDRSIDRVIGILYAKDLLAPVLGDHEPDNGWQSLVRPASFVPEAKTVESQLRDFKATSTHMAIVVDEYGGTAGLMTVEDILEEIVGDIRDEYDVEAPPIEIENARRFWVAGRVTLDELSDAVGHAFDREGVTTVGGMVYDILGHVPQAGEQLIVDGFRVVVERVVRRRVERVYFERLLELAERTA